MILESSYRAHVERLQTAYATAAEELGFAGLVIHSGRPGKKSTADDQYWPLRPTPAFAHWLPLVEPDCALLIAGGRKPRLVRPRVTDFWEGQAPITGEHFWARFEIEEVDDPARTGGLLGPRTAFVGDDAGVGSAWGLPAEAINPPALIEKLDLVRREKSAYELACLAAANRRAAAGHRRVVERFRAGGASELDLHLAYLGATSQDDAEAPYKNIVAIDGNAATLHHVHYGRKPPATGTAHSLLIDAGATTHGYASDITRTEVSGDGAAADQFRALVDRVGAMQQELCAALRPGLQFEELHDRAHQGLAAILRDLAIGRAGADELVARGITRIFLPHGLGHSLGIQVHDVGCKPRPPRPDNPFLRTTCEVFPGMVVTIEPGCYFIAPLLDRLRASADRTLVDWATIDALRGFGGVRIEDDMAVLGDGHPVNLTRENW